jgi:hypothetical protein
LKRQLVGTAIGTPASVGELLNTAFLIAIEDLVAGLAGYPEVPAKLRQLADVTSYLELLRLEVQMIMDKNG